MPDPTLLSIIAPLATKIATTSLEAAKPTAKVAIEKAKIKLKVGFESFISEQFRRHEMVKTIISSSAPMPLRDLYVNLNLTHRNKKVKDDDLLSIVEKNKSILIYASAGAGKSMLMRYLMLQASSEQSERLPIFVELRDLNDFPSMTIQDFVLSRIVEYVSGFSIEQLDYALSEGAVILFLDGLDEIDFDKRKTREREINRLCERYGELLVFVSSRNDEGVAKWQKFFAYEVCPLTKNQLNLLVEKVPYDETTKNTFRDKIKGGLYETHREFLVNPLLAIMMLITLEHFADVPAKIHLFYEYAFEALYKRHDVAKGGGFQRKRRVGLAFDDYKRLFSYFCTITYMRGTFRFSEDQVIGFIKGGLQASQISENAESFLKDLIECTCMVVPDGLDFEFSHRSFQEYFFAYFLARIRPDEIKNVAPVLAARSSTDNILPMVAQMNAEKFEEEWGLQQLNELYDRVSNIDAEKNPIKFARSMFKQRSINVSIGAAIRLRVLIKPNEDHDTRYAVYKSFGMFDRINALIIKSDEDDAEVAKKIMDGELLRDDKRFSEVREMRKLDDGPELFSVRLKESDDSWLKGTFFGRFMAAEAKVLIQVRDEVETRVAERRSGLSSILKLPV